MRNTAYILALISYFATTEAWALSEKIDMRLGCKSNPQLVGSCTAVRGRLSAYNGTPSLRIWPIGTHRLLGVVESEKLRSIPANIRGKVGFERIVFGDFVVCPFSEQKANQMQFVCVEEVSNVHVQKRS